MEEEGKKGGEGEKVEIEAYKQIIWIFKMG